ncbi:hypothetical protein HY745_14960 [Candidatus Desantisbacteria bacterium]|nr:hypothetical protein [Candidatus Desantisbacteria bacterium]
MKNLLFLVSIVSFFSLSVSADDYYNYGGTGNLGIGYTTGAAGFVDNLGKIEGMPGKEYVFIAGSSNSYSDNAYGYIYRVETAGDPNMHPDNPEDTGPIAPRTFTRVGGPNYLGYFGGVHENEFHVDNSGIYFGASRNGLFHWDFGWTNKTQIALAAPTITQSLAYDAISGNWWAGGTYRDMYMYNGSSWVYQGTHPNLSGNHHDGMEIIGDKMFVSDMTSDVLAMYNMDGSIDWNNPDKYFYYTSNSGSDVEGMGYGPNKHLWIGGWDDGTFYELGGGALQHQIPTVPEPATILFFISGIIGLALIKQKK